MDPDGLASCATRPGEFIEDLQCCGLRIIVRRDGFRYGTDSVLLANYVRACSAGHIVELCSGAGAVSILLSAKTRAERITGIEIQPGLADMANRSAELNGIDGKVRFHAGDVRDVRSVLKAGSANAVAVNPPYLRDGSGPGGPDAAAAVSRFEISCGIADVTDAAGWLLAPGGMFYVVYRPDRLTDLFCAMRCSRVEPKEIMPAASPAGKPPPFLLVSGKKNAAPGLRWFV